MRQALAVVLLFSASCAPTLAGQLHGAPDLPFAGEARVNVTELNPVPQAEGELAPKVLLLTVGPDGRFATNEDLPRGDYLVEALVPGYGLQSQKITLAPRARVDLTLQPLPVSKIRATPLNAGLEEGRGAGGAALTPPSL